MRLCIATLSTRGLPTAANVANNATSGGAAAAAAAGADRGRAGPWASGAAGPTMAHRCSSSKAAKRIRKRIDHYGALGIKPTADSKEIKKAYYQMSLKYHPDHSKGKESAEKFQAISAAYDVLSQDHLRQRYDRTLGGGGAVRETKRQWDPRRAGVMDDQHAAYKFREWQSKHYPELLRKEQQRRQRIESMKKQGYEDAKDTSSGTIVFGAVPVVIFILCQIYGGS